MANRAERAALWIRSHGAGERSFSRALGKFFAEQADRIADAVRENFPGGLPSPDAVPLIFRPDDEHDILRPIIRRNLTGLLITGARAEQRAAQRRLDAKAVDDEFGDLNLPPTTLAGLRRALDELEQQDYWLAIQAETEKNLRAIIQQAIDDKISVYSLGMKLREELGGMPANKRAQKIARTETTSALNAGHVAHMAELEADGILIGREWESVGDDDTREAHAALQNVVVPTGQMFSVGGYPAPYPGYWGLPAAQRINCRCTVLAAFDPTLLED